jgi:hypothetical protein
MLILLSRCRRGLLIRSDTLVFSLYNTIKNQVARFCLAAATFEAKPVALPFCRSKAIIPVPVSGEPMNPVRHLRYSLLILVLAVGLGTIGYILIEGWGVLDSLYMTVITLATVGYKEVHDLTTEGKIFTICLIVFGVSTIAYAAGSLLQLMVEGQILRIFGRRKLEKRINQM